MIFDLARRPGDEEKGSMIDHHLEAEGATRIQGTASASKHEGRCPGLGGAGLASIPSLSARSFLRTRRFL